MRFIRKNGRVIPIQDYNTLDRKAVAQAQVVGLSRGVLGRLSHLGGKPGKAFAVAAIGSSIGGLANNLRNAKKLQQASSGKTSFLGEAVGLTGHHVLGHAVGAILSPGISRKPKYSYHYVGENVLRKIRTVK